MENDGEGGRGVPDFSPFPVPNSLSEERPDFLIMRQPGVILRNADNA